MTHLRDIDPDGWLLLNKEAMNHYEELRHALVILAPCDYLHGWAEDNHSPTCRKCKALGLLKVTDDQANHWTARSQHGETGAIGNQGRNPDGSWKESI